MLFVSHDFYGNFTGSVSSGDSELTISIFNSELSDLLAYKEQQLLSVFDKSNVKYKSNMSYSALIDVVYDNMASNEKFLRGLTFLISKNNDIESGKSKAKFNGMMEDIIAGLSSIANEFKENKSVREEAKLDTLEMVKLKTSLSGGTTRAIKDKDNTVLLIIVFAGMAVGGYYLWKYLKNRPSTTMTAGLPPMPTTPAVEAPKVNAPPPNPYANDPAMNVSPDVLVPASQTPQMAGGGATPSPAATTVTITSGAPAAAQPATATPPVKPL